MKKIIIIITLIVSAAVGGRINAQNNMDIKKQSLVAIAALEAKGDLTSLKSAINEGLDNGLTVNQVKEALSQLYAYTGFPRSLNALGVLQAVVADREAAGQTTVTGPDSEPLPADYDALKRGTEVQTRLTGKAFDYDFAPQTDYYLKAHLFGDIFARTTLSWPEREIVTVSAISALEGCEPQLKAHVSGARNMGVSDDDIHAIAAVLKSKVGAVEGYRASKAIAEVYGEAFNEGQPVDGTWAVGEPNTGYAKYFIGNSYLNLLATGEGKLPVSNVTFEPGCRNNWHVHHKGGQILIVVAGRGWYQEWGKPAQELHEGDVVDIPAGTKHWHGAAKDSWFQHIAIGVPAEGATSEWLEPVTDEVYNKLP